MSDDLFTVPRLSERLARVEEHALAVNGDIREIKETLKDLRDVQREASARTEEDARKTLAAIAKLCADFGEWRGQLKWVVCIPAAVVGAVVAAIVTFAKSIIAK